MTGTGGRLVQCDPDALADALARLADRDAAAVPALGPEARGRLAKAARDLTFRTARPVVGQAGREVSQDFRIADRVPHDGPFGQAARELGAEVARALGRLRDPPFDAVTFNDLVIQHYPETDCGISPHRDHVKYVKLIANLAIEGHGRFYICPDRTGADAREIPAAPGDAILMRGPGYRGRTDRPFHAVGAVESPRLVLGLREDSRAV